MKKGLIYALTGFTGFTAAFVLGIAVDSRAESVVVKAPTLRLAGSYLIRGSGRTHTLGTLYPAGVAFHTGVTGMLDADGAGNASIALYSNVSAYQFPSTGGFAIAKVCEYGEGTPGASFGSLSCRFETLDGVVIFIGRYTITSSGQHAALVGEINVFKMVDGALQPDSGSFVTLELEQNRM